MRTCTNSSSILKRRRLNLDDNMQEQLRYDGVISLDPRLSRPSESKVSRRIVSLEALSPPHATFYAL